MAVRVSKDNFDDVVLKNTIPVLVDFYSDSCVACKKLSPVLGEIEDEYEDKISVVKLNTNFDAELSAEYGVVSNPTMILFVNGQNVGKKIGAASFEDIEAWISEYI